MNNKRGFEMSFSFIFSVILIGVIIFVSFYVIGKFIGVKNRAEQGMFYDNFQERINRAWNSEIVNDVFEGRVPSGIDKVCLGNISVASSIPEYEELQYASSRSNVFMYPSKSNCEGLDSNKINHIGFDYPGIKCFDVNGGKVIIKIKKDSLDSWVKLVE